MDDFRNDIEKYLRGELSDAGRYAIEKKALSDPFLADALEGGESIGPEAFSSDVASLRATSGRVRRTPLTMRLLRAAAVLTLIGLVTVLVILGIRDRHNQLALNQPEKGVSEEKNLPGGGVEHQDTLSPMARSESAKEERQVAPQAKEKAGRRNVTVPAPEAVTPPASKPGEEEITQEHNAPLGVRESLPANDLVRKKDMRQKKTIQGVVTDAGDGTAIPGVNVTIKGKNTGTITDEEGRFVIELDSLKNALVFSFIGFESRELIPGPVPRMNVQLKPDLTQLSEVVVVGDGDDSDLPAYPTFEMAAPAGGRKAFKDYLERNLRYPHEALNAGVEGKVTVQFTVDQNGSLTDFRVVKGIGYGCDEEVIRLIRQGPKWSPTKRDDVSMTDRVRVRMRFRLPGKK